MEFSDIGAHCNYTLCKQKDFLPFTCDACLQIFCKDHRTYKSHECDKPSGYDSVQLIICPLCGLKIKIMETDDADEIFRQHESEGCDPSKMKKEKKFKCIKCNKGLSDIKKLTCKICHGAVCVKHRMQSDHNCRGRPLSKLVTGGLPRATPIQSSIRSEEVKQVPTPISSHPPVASHIPTSSAPISQPTSSSVEKCPVCDITFANITDLIAHTESHFSAPTPPPPAAVADTEQCPICNKYFAISELVRHCEQDHIL
ncbi:unnamed protein product [Moneuplotes crassus]|uniref:AN1-type domain-containing protein n=1 Tax=Euplotes crassus TaxID=5936 RepID=A0AAD1XSS8_EUPCR|nr:unnamed protein product [Moneuplotes crassus]